ncbi:MAG: hypothetical protein GY763_00555 [Gammaproteobacteria bacterium]|nr:hypothetical protein [Gammaproteobacteria bacterium]
MIILYALAGSGAIILLLLYLWLKERKQAQREYIAYGLRSGDDSDENTKTNLNMMEAGYREALNRLEDLGEVGQDQWGQWVWKKSGKPLGDILSRN